MRGKWDMERILDFLGIMLVSDTKETKNAKMDNECKNERRGTRLAAIIGIVATIGGLELFLFRISGDLLEAKIQSGTSIYMCMLVGFILTLSIGVLLILGIIVYVYYDLHRYNVLRIDCTEYDQKSDEAYDYLINDFKFGFVTLCIECMILMLIVMRYATGIAKGVVIFAVIVVFLVGILCFMNWKDKTDSNEKKETCHNVRKYIFRYIKRLAFVSVLTLSVWLPFASNNMAEVSVTFEEDGMITVMSISEGEGEQKELLVEVNDVKSNRVDGRIEGIEDAMLAGSGRVINFEMEGRVIKKEQVVKDLKNYRKHQLSLTEMIKENGRYEVVINLGNAEIYNDVIVENGSYIFTQYEILQKYSLK